jgi:hypothetical protein
MTMMMEVGSSAAVLAQSRWHHLSQTTIKHLHPVLRLQAYLVDLHFLLT